MYKKFFKKSISFSPKFKPFTSAKVSKTTHGTVLTESATKMTQGSKGSRDEQGGVWFYAG